MKHKAGIIIRVIILLLLIVVAVFFIFGPISIMTHEYAGMSLSEVKELGQVEEELGKVNTYKSIMTSFAIAGGAIVLAIIDIISIAVTKKKATN